jgi:hypothetical protein
MVLGNRASGVPSRLLRCAPVMIHRTASPPPKTGSSQIGLQATPRVRRAAKSAAVPSQAPATVSIAESSADTFPAVYALHPADASTCRASFAGACLAVELEGAPVRPPDRDRFLHLSCGPGVHEIARRGSVTAGSRGAPAAWVPPSKRGWPPATSHPSADPPLRLHRTPCQCDGSGAHPGRHMICRACNEIDETQKESEVCA